MLAVTIIIAYGCKKSFILKEVIKEEEDEDIIGFSD